MASEILAVPEENLADVIYIIRVGLDEQGVAISDEVFEQLHKWCDEEEAYLNGN